MREEKTAKEIFDLLVVEALDKPGKIVFNLAETEVVTDTTDIVGNSLQSWLKQWLINKNIYESEPENTQAFPDFYLSNVDKEKHMLEVKAFNYNATPAFDIANYESYVASVSEKPWRLDADYLIFGYVMSSEGEIRIKKIWLKKIWEIAGTSNNYPLRTQVKRGMIYNIRPNSEFKKDESGPFSCKEDFLKAIYDTHASYKNKIVADEWKNKLKQNYLNYYNESIEFQL